MGNRLLEQAIPQRKKVSEGRNPDGWQMLGFRFHPLIVANMKMLAQGEFSPENRRTKDENNFF